jgi:uncharacterized repeat protein (TIGR03803 family)
MRNRLDLELHRKYCLVIAVLVVGISTLASSQTLTVLYDFSGGSDGGVPTAGLVFDKSANLYGTTLNGGTCPCSLGCGTVFKMSPRKGAAGL